MTTEKNNVQDHPLPDSYWVVPGQFLAGAYPGARWEGQARKRLRQLLDAGVTFVLDLTEEGEYGIRPYAPLLGREASERKRRVVRWRMSIPDMDTPTREQMARILDVIDGELREGHVVYVHCYGGIGRTGTVVGCYLVRHGMDGDRALAEIAYLRRGASDGWQLSPQTKAQREMVQGWSECSTSI